MPLYDVECTNCAKNTTVFRKIAELSEVILCECGGGMVRLLRAPMLAPSFRPFISPGTGEIVNSPSQHREDLKKSGCVLYEPGMRAAIARRREEQKEKAFEPIAKAVDETLRARLAVDTLEN